MQKSNKIVLFDIDHTLFNTNLYRDKLYKNLAAELKCELDDFYKIGEKRYKKIRGTKPYLTPDHFLEVIIPPSKKPYDIEKMRSIFWDKKLYESCMYADVKKAFSYLIDNNFKIGIFSTGDPEHQKIKIESIKEYLSKNHIHISADKLKVIKDTFSTYNNYKTYLVDDYLKILETAKTHDKNIFTVLIKRKDGYPADIIIPSNFKPDATITNLSELSAIIRNNN